ncbi:serine/threonine-protein phosphatase 5 [Tribonema minus]|uniref:Serine/threonine-protein phosphatase T n=1 Tax=Tribonema minus TaxID=303371 RepID=A0A835YLG0_9STRA|nr:serine/threonine-protein phosphatase 5 [Tribonema minus]
MGDAGGDGVEQQPQEELLEKANKLKEQGNKQLADGHLIQAVELYSQAIDLVPTAVFYGNRAFTYLKMENYGLAISDSDEAIRLNSDYVKAYYRRASANMVLGKYKLALKDLRQVVKTHPGDKDARLKFKACEKAAREAAFAAAIMQEEEEPLCTRVVVQDILVDPAYDGPALGEDLTVTMDFVRAMIERFRAQKLVAKRYVVAVLQQAFALLRATPSLMRLRVPADGADGKTGAFTVCGDTHGQFYDLLHIFELNGLPAPDNPYLFNGDFVDRGSFSFEVVTTLLALKVACPEAIHLTRGNHESKNMNKIYGFEGEVKHKYDAAVMTMFAEVFCWLPLCATLNDKVFIVHGGLPSTDGVTLDDTEGIDRNREPPESGLMSDLMWSDPQPFEGRSPSKRGIGMSFGPDVTKAFLDGNGLELLVRSHEVKEEGYLVEHDGRCITVFSAPNYCDQMANKAAFIRFGHDCKPQFTQYEASPHPPIRPMAYATNFSGFGM